MKAAQITQYGGQEALRINDSVPKPVPGPKQVLVEVRAAAINPFDWKVREGMMKDFISLNLPATLGGDVSGIVSELGDDVSGFEIGQEVYGMANAAGGQGSFAEFTPVAVSQLALKPRKTNFVEAAALPLAGVSAYQALVDHIGLRPGQKILIHGGAGGIGSMAIQIAKHLGASVATTAQADDEGYVKGLGADLVIDYQAQDFSEILRDYDAVFDTVGGDTNLRSYRVLKQGGAFVSMVEAPDENLVNEKNLSYIYQQSKATPERLARVKELVEAGKLKVNIDKTFTLDQAAEALEYTHAGHPRGKIVIEIK